jgi:hypothetical protein
MKTISQIECCLEQLADQVNGVTVTGDKVFSGNVTVQSLAVVQDVSTTGDIQAGAFAVEGYQVVGARGAAVANATDAASVILRLNDLLARLRTHGLIGME